MKTVKKTLLATSLLMLSVLPAVSTAAPVTLSFESSPPLVPIAMNSAAASSFLQTGISFSANAWLAAGQDGDPDTSDDDDPYGNFKGGPGSSAVNKGAVTLTSDPNRAQNPNPPPLATSFTITVDKGFNGFFSLIFAGDRATSASITLFDMNGDELTDAKFHASAPSAALCTGNIMCNWTSLYVDLDDTVVKSIQVTGVDGKQWFDDFSFGNLLADNPGGNVPEPGGIALSLAALGGLALTRRRSTKR